MLQLAGPTRVPGQYVIRNTKYGPVMQKWPKKRPEKKSPGAIYAENRWAMACTWASAPDAGQLDSAIVFAKGTMNVPRDFLTMNAYGTHTRFYFDDGTEWTRYRDVTANAQYVLDQVIDEAPAILIRDANGWVGLQPTEGGQALLWDGTQFQFLTLDVPDAVTTTNYLNGFLAPNVAATVPVNIVGGTAVTLRAGTIVSGVAFTGNAANAASVVGCALYSRTGNVPGARVALGPQATGVVQGINTRDFAAPYLVPADDLYFAAITNHTSAFNQYGSNSTIWGFSGTSSYPPANPLTAITSSYVATWPKTWVY